MRCTQATLESFCIYGVCPLYGVGVLSELRKHFTCTPVDGMHGLKDVMTWQGSYYLFTNDHAMALIDGVLTDTSHRKISNRIKVFAIKVNR